MSKLWQVYDVQGTHWLKIHGWIESGETYTEAKSNAKRSQSRTGGAGAIDVQEYQEEDG
jgi:hypothetical protein